MLPRLSKMSPMQTSSSFGVRERASNDQLWRNPTSLMRSARETEGNCIDGRRLIESSCEGGGEAEPSRNPGGTELGSDKIEDPRPSSGDASGDAGIVSRGLDIPVRSGGTSCDVFSPASSSAWAAQSASECASRDARYRPSLFSEGRSRCQHGQNILTFSCQSSDESPQRTFDLFLPSCRPR